MVYRLPIPLVEVAHLRSRRHLHFPVHHAVAVAVAVSWVRWAVAEAVPPLLRFLLRMRLLLRAIAVCTHLDLAEVVSVALLQSLEVP